MRRTLPGILALAAATLFVYLPGLQAPPSFDDALLDVLPKTHGSLEALWKAFRDPVPPTLQGVPLPAYVWRPLTEASLALNAWVTGWDDLEGMRLGNLLLHVAGALGVWWVLARFVGKGWGFWGGLWYALHPIGVQAVTYVYQRSVELEGLLFVFTLGQYLKARESGSWRWYAGAFLTGLLAMGAKEPAVTLPLVLGVLERVLERRPGALRRWLPFTLLPALVAFQVWRAMDQADPVGADRYRESGIHPVGYGFSRLEYLCLQMPIVLDYIRLAVFPFPLSFYHDRTYPAPGTPVDIPWGTTLVSALVLTALLFFVLRGGERWRLPRLGLGLFLAPLALECTVFPIQDLAFHHRCYPGLPGGALLFAWALSRLPRPLVLGAAVLGCMASLAIQENRTWADPPRLLARDVRHAWHRTTIWTNLAWKRQELGRPEEAERFFRKALRSAWQTQRTRAGLAASLRAQGRPEASRVSFAQAMKDYPKDATLLWTALLEAIEAGDASRVDALAARAGELPMLRSELLLWLASYRLERGDAKAAQALLERHARLYPTYPQLWDLLGVARRDQGDLVGAREAFRKALALDPSLQETRRDLEALQSGGDPAE